MDRHTHSEQQPPLALWSATPADHTSPHSPVTITPYLPDAARSTGSAIVVCPGGGYEQLAPHEGHDYALWLNAHGISAFVLHYRLGSAGYRHPAMLEDASRALRLIRARSADWSIDPARIGIMGSSAGGHLAATLLTHFDGGSASAADPVEHHSARPDLGILCYPVISMRSVPHLGSRDNLLGDDPPVELIDALSNELHVTPETPACFVWHTWDDDVVDVEHSLAFATALRRNNVDCELHVYPRGGHGIGLGDTAPFATAHPWTQALARWLAALGWIRQPGARP